MPNDLGSTWTYFFIYTITYFNIFGLISFSGPFVMNTQREIEKLSQTSKTLKMALRKLLIGNQKLQNPENKIHYNINRSVFIIMQFCKFSKTRRNPSFARINIRSNNDLWYHHSFGQILTGKRSSCYRSHGGDKALKSRLLYILSVKSSWGGGG